MSDSGFWRGRRVFLTGHTGFKGSWLALWLTWLGADLTGYSLAPDTEPNLFTLARVHDGMTSVIGDVRDENALRAALSAARPELVIHMAAQPLVRKSYANPVETYATNVMGTVHVLEAVRSVPGVKAALVVTTDKCYENREWVWGYRESDGLGGYDPYSSSKACAELVTAAYRSSYFDRKRGRCAAIASARAGNVIGGGDWAAERLVPDVVRAIQRRDAVVIRNPGAVRPWQHVLEPLRGYLMLSERLYEDEGALSEAWNFGPDDADMKPVQWVVERLTSRWGEGATWTHDLHSQPHEAGILKLDCSKARNTLGWNPRWRLEEAIEKTVSWYRAASRAEDMKAFTLSQIRAYTNAPVS